MINGSTSTLRFLKKHTHIPHTPSFFWGPFNLPTAHLESLLPVSKHGITMLWRLVLYRFPKIGVPQNGWFRMENPFKMDDLGYHYFWKHPYAFNVDVSWICTKKSYSAKNGSCPTYFPLLVFTHSTSSEKQNMHQHQWGSGQLWPANVFPHIPETSAEKSTARKAVLQVGLPSGNLT